MTEPDEITRRKLLAGLLGLGGSFLLPGMAFADDDGNDDSGDDDSGGGGDDNGGDDNSDSGGSDDDGSDDDGSDDNGGNDTSGDNGGSANTGGGGSNRKSGSSDQDKVKQAVLKGEAISLASALEILRKQYSGRVIEVLYVTKRGRIDYKFKIVDNGGKVVTVTMDASSGRIRNFLGF